MYLIWCGRHIVPTKTATKEMVSIGINLEKVLDVLETGYDDPKARRKKGTIVKCSTLKDRYIKVVAVESYQYSTDTEVWLITLVGD